MQGEEPYTVTNVSANKLLCMCTKTSDGKFYDFIRNQNTTEKFHQFTCFFNI